MRRAILAAAVTAVLVASPAVANAGGKHNDLREYAKDTWASLDAMTVKTTGLTADNIEGDLTAPADYTSPTNIGGYLWSTIVARDLGIITQRDARARLATTLDTLGSIERHEPSGMYYNWYSPETGAKLQAQYDDQGRAIYSTARIWDDGVIDPRSTRDVIANALAATTQAELAPVGYGVFRM